jgi:hypothetical protein
MAPPMKPRLSVAPWTKEDAAILWCSLSGSEYLTRCRTRGMYIAQDRRDADIMFTAQNNKTLGNICMDGALFDWEFDVIVRRGLWRAYWALNV